MANAASTPKATAKDKRTLFNIADLLPSTLTISSPRRLASQLITALRLTRKNLGWLSP
jgi:hypothetical protein